MNRSDRVGAFSTHLPSLDGLRGLAVLIVIAHNTQMFEPTPPGLGNAVLFYALNFGWMGVQLFFVLSGFLITGILLDTRSQPHWWRDFMVRRILRIFPLYYGTLAVIFLLLPGLSIQPSVFADDNAKQWSLWLFLSNWTESFGMGGSTVPHFWSLAVEEQFYLLWPLLIWWLRRPSAVLKSSLIIAGISLLVRVWLIQHQFTAQMVYSWTPCRMDALALGGAAAAAWRTPGIKAWLIRYRRQWLCSLWALAAVTFLLTRGFPRVGPSDQTWGYSVLALLFTGLVLSAALNDTAHGTPAFSVWRMHCLRFVGRYSYGMYVFHRLIHEVYSQQITNRLGVTPASSAGVAVAHVIAITLCSLGLAIVSYHCYEIHFLRLKRHFA